LNIPIFERKMAGYLRRRIQHFLNTDIIPGLPILFQVAGSGLPFDNFIPALAGSMISTGKEK